MEATNPKIEIKVSFEVYSDIYNYAIFIPSNMPKDAAITKTEIILKRMVLLVI